MQCRINYSALRKEYNNLLPKVVCEDVTPYEAIWNGMSSEERDIRRRQASRG